MTNIGFNLVHEFIGLSFQLIDFSPHHFYTIFKLKLKFKICYKTIITIINARIYVKREEKYNFVFAKIPRGRRRPCFI